MWINNESPGCFYDTIDCTGTCCEEGKEMYERYIKEKYNDDDEQNDEQK